MKPFALTHLSVQTALKLFTPSGPRDLVGEVGVFGAVFLPMVFVAAIPTIVFLDCVAFPFIFWSAIGGWNGKRSGPVPPKE